MILTNGNTIMQRNLKSFQDKKKCQLSLIYAFVASALCL